MSAQDTSGRAARLAGLFRSTLNGTRKIGSVKEAKLFFEAAQAQSPPSSCVETIIASKQGVEALRFAARADLSPAFIKFETLQFIGYLADDQLKVLADGQILQKALIAIVKPPTLWNELVNIARELDDKELKIFCWLCLELLSLPQNVEVDVFDDVEAFAQSGKLVEASSSEIRQLGYKIQRLLQLRKSSTARSGDGYTPGGRHDNDFEDFRQISVYPTTDEFLSTERPFYRRAREVFEVNSAERPGVHLDNLFRLTREDLLVELRSDWQIEQGRKRGTRSALTLRKLDPVRLEFGDDKFRKNCSVVISCIEGLERLENVKPGQRKKWLLDNKNFLRHEAFGALYRGEEIFGFAFIDRSIEGLLESPPEIILKFTDDKALKRSLLALKTVVDVNFTLVGTPVYAYEPVLERLKDMKELPLQDKLLSPSEALDDFVPSKLMESFVDRLASATNTTVLIIRNADVRKEVRLDRSQRQSLINALTMKVSVIQGPPGTGKSFIGALASHFILEQTNFKILVITYTNHALDQFLEELLDLSIETDEIVRLGSKSTTRTQSLLLSDQRSGNRRSKEAWAVIDKLKEEVTMQSEELRESFARYSQSHPTFHDIQDYLEFSEEESKFFEAFVIPPENDGFKKVGRGGREVRPDYLYENWKNGYGPGMFKKYSLSQHKDVWDVEPSLRRKYIEKWFSAILQEKVERVQELARQYNLTKEQMDGLFRGSKVEVLREKRIIGCTTTAAAKYTKLITSAEPDVVIVEEAGEIEESHVLAALTPSVKQLILIGDHKQLRPKVNNYNLTVEKGEGYDLNRSLFERLILQGHPHTSLQKQHRMHPDISVLIRELVYPELEDDPKTHQRPPIRGLEDRVIFVNHSHPEVLNERIADRRDQGTKSSKENIFEAEMVLKTVRYLAQQGYGTKNMVVLTPYLGQLRLVRDMLLDASEVDPLLGDLDSHGLIQAGLMTHAAANVNKERLRISTIDNYQGEEADIVIVSLTRSNSDGEIGFLAARERLNVLLSRARCCLIMFGNMETYMKSKKGKETWVPFFESLKAKGHLHDGLPVICEKHPERKSLLKESKDFDKCCPDGGCAEPCGIELNCGLHNCALRCHRVEDHSKMPCSEKVEMVCDRGHKLKVPCHKRNDKCSKCVQEDLEAERRIKRDLKLEAERQARQEAYKRELQEIQDEIDHQRRVIKYQKDDEEQRKTLDQQRADLAALKNTADRILNAPKPQNGPTMPGAFPDTALSTTHSDPDLGDSHDVPEGAKQEWEYLKQFEGAKSEPLDDLVGMIGLEDVKSEFLSIKSGVDRELRQNIALENERFSCSMVGNPGTGKTTVARLYARFLTSIGVIPGSCFKEETGASLASAGVNGCKKIVDDMLNDGGGVLFIDEAYQLTSGNSYGGGAVLDYLLPEVENLRGKIVFVLAGYDKQMESLFAHNPGLPSRFPICMKFKDYEDNELLRIFELYVHKKYNGRMRCEDGLRGLYCRIATRRVGRSRGREGFGNARAVENLLQVVSKRQGVRLSRERRGGKKPDDLFFTKEDLIGPEPAEALTKSKAWQKLQKLTGLEAVKGAVKSLVDSVRQNYLRELDEQPPIEYSLNRLFLGNPGTGKTTVAKLYGEILADLGMLSKGEVVVKNPSDFVGAHLGHSEQQTKGILASSVGKVLVIDEAYGLYGGDGSTTDPYKSAVIDTIVAEVQSVPGDDRCVLLLGYKDQMENMFQNVNPGLSRRFPISSAFEFEDFKDDELRQILDMKLRQQGYAATDQAKRVAMEVLSRARNRPNFGNAGEVDILLDTAKARHQSRYSKRETRSDSTLEALDFDENFDRAERADTNVAKLFEGTVGQEEIVSLLQNYQETVKTMKSVGMDPKEDIPFNFLFRGPPGTGKTTTAKKMGKVFYDMGFLATAEVVECSATDLIGQFVGQTGPKVQKQLEKALGKVLFIDEAYRLAGPGFAKEAMDELVDATTKEKYCKKLIIILAGYENDINRLMATNPGLTSRFPQVINFPSLNPDQCVNLLRRELKSQQSRLAGPKSKRKVSLDISVIENVDSSFLGTLHRLFFGLSRQENWANARDVKTVSSGIFKNTLRDKEGLAKGHLIVRRDTIEAELRDMFQERACRSMNVSSLPRALPDNSEPIAQLPLSPEGPRSATTASTSQATKAKMSENPPDEEEKAPRKKPRTLSPSTKRPRKEATRDAGVSDEVWDQLQRDREAEEKREEEYQDLLKAQRTARAEERERIVKRLLEEEQRRRKEEEMRKKLKMMGACPVGYPWIKQSGGYRCAGGSHFLSDDALTGL